MKILKVTKDTKDEEQRLVRLKNEVALVEAKIEELKEPKYQLELNDNELTMLVALFGNIGGESDIRTLTNKIYHEAKNLVKGDIHYYRNIISFDTNKSNSKQLKIS